MIQPAEAAPIVYSTIKDSIRHKHYQRTVDLAEKYLKLVTGEDADTLLQQIVTRESEAQFNLRKKLFFPIPPAVCRKARVPFAKVPKADGLVDEIEYEGAKDEEKRERLDTALDEFWGDENLDDYMADRFLDLNMTDPNAYLIVEFKPFDNENEVAKPYPLEVSSKQCINKGVHNNSAQWIIAQFDHKYREVKADGQVTIMDGKRFLMYFGWIYDVKQVQRNDGYPKAINPEEKFQLVNIGDLSYSVELLDPFTMEDEREFQGICVGHIKDPYTYGESYVSVIHAAVNRMMETLKSGSERSLTMSLTAHPQVYQYLPKCEGEGMVDGVNLGCIRGTCLETNTTCAACNGSGKKIPTSVLDAMYFDLPDGAIDGDNIMELSRLKHYSAPDTAIITLLNDYLTTLEQKCLMDIFTAASLDDKPKFETATKVSIDEDAQNSAVYPYGRKWATVKIKLTRMAATFVDAAKGLTYSCKVPSRLQLAPFEQILERVKMAKDLGSPTLYELMERDAVASRLAERPLEVRKYEVRKMFRPLEGLNEAQKREYGALLTLRDQIMIAYETEIYLAMDEVDGFYYMTADKQRELIGVKLDEIMQRVKKDKAKEVDFSEMLRIEKGGEEPGQGQRKVA